MEKSGYSSLIFGPEIIWGLLYLLAIRLAKANAAPPHPLDNFMEKLYFWVPVAGLLTFSLWYFPGVEKNWLLLRVWLACMIGGHLVLDTSMKGYSKQGPGIGMGYLAGLILMFIALMAGTIFIKIRF